MNTATDIILRYVPGHGFLPIVVDGHVPTCSGSATETYRGGFKLTAQEALDAALDIIPGQRAEGPLVMTPPPFNLESFAAQCLGLGIRKAI